MSEIDVIDDLTPEIVEVITSPSPEIIEVVETGPVGPPGDTAVFPFSKPNILAAPYTSPYLFPIPFTCTLAGIEVSVGTAPTGQGIILDLYKNGVSIYPGGTGRPTIPVGSRFGTGTPGASFLDTDYLTVGITQVGSVVPGSSLLLLLSLKRS